MYKKIKFKIVTCLVFILGSIVLCADLYAQEDFRLYQEAIQAAKQGKPEFAFMHFHSLLKFSSASYYYAQAVFATGEYYYSIGNFRQAAEQFNLFLQKYPDSDAFPFAAIYLLKIYKAAGWTQGEHELKKHIIQFVQLSLLFREFKEHVYWSAMNINYKARYFIDKVEFYINGTLFEKVNF